MELASLDHLFFSKWLLSTLSRLGLSASLDEVYGFRQSVVQYDMEDLPTDYP